MPQRYGKMLERTRKGVLQYRETMLQICKNTENFSNDIHFFCKNT